MQINNALASYAPAQAATGSPAARSDSTATPASSSSAVSLALSPAALAALQAEEASLMLLGDDSGPGSSGDPLSALLGDTSSGASDSLAAALGGGTGTPSGSQSIIATAESAFLGNATGSEATSTDDGLGSLLTGYMSRVAAQDAAAVQQAMARLTGSQSAITPAG